MARLIDMYPDDVVIEGSRRAVNLDRVTELAASIKSIGLQTPITVLSRPHPDGENYGREIVLVAGLHRLEAAKQLGLTEIACTVMDNAADARMWEIAENLHRSELTVLERAEHIEEWRKLAEAKLGQLAPVCRGGRGKEGGVRAAARELGVERTEVRRASAIASMPEPIKQEARQAGIDDNQSKLLQVAKAPDPVVALAAIKREKELTEARRANKQTDAVIASAAAEEFGEWLLARTDLHELPTIISWLQGTKPAEVIAVLRRKAA